MVLSRTQGATLGRLAEMFGELSIIEHDTHSVRVRIEGLRDRLIAPDGETSLIGGDDEQYECEEPDCTALGTRVGPDLGVACQRHHWYGVVT